MQVRGPLLVVAVTLAALACKKNTEVAATKSLDDLTGVRDTQTQDAYNSCVGNQPVIATREQLQIEGDSDAVRAALVTSLSAVPTALQDTFFNRMKGTIVVGKPQAGKEATSYWVPAADDAVSIFIKAGANEAETVRNVQSTVMQEFGYWLIELPMKLGKSQKGTEIVNNEGLFQVEGDIAIALLDVVSKNKNMKLDAFKDDLPAGLLDAGISRAERRKRFAAVATTQGGRRFAETAFVEALDSWYCDVNKTRPVMKQLFSKTSEGPGPYEIMENFSKGIDCLGQAQNVLKACMAQIPDGDIPKDTGGNGANLFGRWGPGNGPIRQAFSNWADWRAEGHGLFNFRRFADGGGFVFANGPLATSSYTMGQQVVSDGNGNYTYSDGTMNAPLPVASDSSFVNSAYTSPSSGFVSGYSFNDPGYTYYDNSASYVYYYQ
jgi:hypothetical protein